MTAVLVFYFALTSELALMASSLKTQLLHPKLRAMVHLLTAVLFTGLVWFSVIPWSFRWYGLTIFLALQAVGGLWTLVRSAMEEGSVSKMNILLRSTISLLLTFCAISPALIFPTYQPVAPTGNYTVATARYTYTDEHRMEQFAANGLPRKVTCSCWYPENTPRGATFPLIIFSHGGLGLETSNESLFLELASHGYVVCSIGHPFHAFWTKSTDGHTTFVSMAYFGELQMEDARRDPHQSFRLYQRWLATRTGDINLVLDTILQNAAEGIEGIYPLVDTTRIGMMGHSLGGSAALALPRQREDIDAVLALESPFLFDILAVKNDSFIFTEQPYPVPVLNIYSDGAWDHLSEWPQYEKNFALLSDTPQTAYNLHLAGAGHFSLTDLALASPLLVRMLEGKQPERSSVEYLQELNRVSLEFFNRYLKDLQPASPIAFNAYP